MHHGSFGIKSPQSVTRLFRPAKALSSVAKSCFESWGNLPHFDWPHWSRAQFYPVHEVTLQQCYQPGRCPVHTSLHFRRCLFQWWGPQHTVADRRFGRFGCFKAETLGVPLGVGKPLEDAWHVDAAVIHHFTWHHRVAKHIISPKGFGERWRTPLTSHRRKATSHGHISAGRWYCFLCTFQVSCLSIHHQCLISILGNMKGSLPCPSNSPGCQEPIDPAGCSPLFTIIE